MKALASYIKESGIKKVFIFCFLVLITIAVAEMIVAGGVIVPFALIALPFFCMVIYMMFAQPRAGMFAAFVVAYVVNGLGRYIVAPFGLTLDFVLLATFLATIFSLKGKEWARAKSPVVWLTLVWFGFTMLEIFNPEARSFEAWFYAVRGISFYMVFLVPLVLLIFHREKDLDNMFTVWFAGGIIAALYGMNQLYIGLNAAEQAWLATGASETHILFGRLRVFSFFSDAGQFGAFMGFTAIVATILTIRQNNLGRRIFFGLTAAICFYGMMISGTRGALFVPLSGCFAYLFLSKNFKILIVGFAVIGIVFYVLKYTFIGQGNYQVQRMRTALDPQDPSFQVRLENQKKYKAYLSSRPFGGGIGSAGYWGQRFSPGTFLAETPTDSHYVRIWAETGIVGLVVHLGVLISILIISFFRIYKIPDPDIKQKLMAIYAGCFGIIVASYGNQVIGQMPTNVFFYMSLAFLFAGPEWV
ncbi:MAG: O-antigen ligase family protein, partial [Cytophagaceae bacterium]|nr:O-antigen ligase family protein [Cytophagaceae bacterium]